MKRFVTVVTLVTAVTLFSTGAFAQSQPLSGHALAKIGSSILKFKKAAAVPVFAAEAGVDVAHVFTKALSLATGDELAHDDAAAKLFFPVHKVFQGADFVVGKIDSGMEVAELYLWGSSN